MLQTRNFKFRLYPTHIQKDKMEENLNVCRWIYNKFVEHTQNGFLSRNDLNYLLTELKQAEPWLYKYHSKMLQMVSTQLEAAQKSLIRLQENDYSTGKLKFVSIGEYSSFTYNQTGYRLDKHGGKNLLWLSKIGFVEIRQHRELLGTIKQIIISKSKSGKWHAIITCDIDIVILPQIKLRKAVGIDVGIKNFAYDSNGHSTPNPMNLKKLLKPLAKVQRKISRRQKGSKNRKKAVKLYQIIHERIANRRKDFQHKLSTHYAKNNDVIFIERLAKLNMVKNNKLARNIMDSSWGSFCNMLGYKCKMLIEVPARNTSIDCSRCGNVVPKSLAIRIHICNVCGLMLDRDHNASINILKKGFKIFSSDYELPQELREVTPVKILTGSRKQEKSIIIDSSSHLNNF